MSTPQKLPDKSICVLGLWIYQIPHANNVIQAGVFGIVSAWTLFHDGIRLAKVIRLNSVFMKLDPNRNPHRKTQFLVVSLTFHTQFLWKWSVVHTTPQQGVVWKLTHSLSLGLQHLRLSSFDEFNLYPFALLNWQSKHMCFKYLKCFYDKTQKRL